MSSDRLYNGILLPEQWPPLTESHLNRQPMRVPYLEAPPDVIEIDLGRQLFVDDFLIEETMMPQRYYHPVKHTLNPVFFPETPLERQPPLERATPARTPLLGGARFCQWRAVDLRQGALLDGSRRTR